MLRSTVRRVGRFGILGLGLLSAGCAATGGREAPPELARIASIEDARAWDGPEGRELVETFAKSPLAQVRQRAAVALGRMPWPEAGHDVTRALLALLKDEDAQVRAAAAFGLGMRGDASAADTLLFVALDHHDADSEAEVRARALEAATKLARPELRQQMLEGLRDADPRVRVEAAQGASRWPAAEADAAEVNRRLVEHLALETNRDVVTLALATLERRKAPEALALFRQKAESPEAEQRIFAVRGLRALAAKEDVQRELLDAASDADVRVACEALIALGQSTTSENVAQLAAATRHANASVRRTAWEALGAVLQRDESQYAKLQALGVEARALGSASPQETSPWVRGAMHEAGLRSLVHDKVKGGVADETLTLVGTLYSRLSREERIGVLRGVAALDAERALPVLFECFKDPDFAVGGVAIELAGTFDDPRVRPALHTALTFGDNGLRLAAVTALLEKPDKSDFEPLQRCLASSKGDGTNEIRFNALRAAAKGCGESAWPLLVPALTDPSPFVRRVAREELAKLGHEIPDGVVTPRAPVVALELPHYAANPLVDVVTSRGKLRLELLPSEAPLHVHNFLTLAARDHYDGTPWHRVVPDFVAQGGDYRRDGNGGGTWRGRDEALRHEIGPRKYVRGSLGMPRNEDPDSGGSQIFLTHRATPHLDGRYTIFGELRDGFDVLDSLEVGDTILDVVRVR
ncbi:MAG: HEAT repeat domain-containing protein [Planctomycetota bacterium]|nr:HEAT repeat domain-containing protein [Planctomycetota bacterium]